MSSVLSFQRKSNQFCEVYLTATTTEPGASHLSAGVLNFYSGYIKTYKKKTQPPPHKNQKNPKNIHDSLAGTFTAEILVINKTRQGDDRRIR